MAERDKNRSCSPPVPGPSGSTTLTTELVRREERERNPHTVESLVEVFRSVSLCLSWNINYQVDFQYYYYYYYH